MDLVCPICETEPDLEAAFEPGSAGSRDEPPYGEQLVDLTGCAHAGLYLEGKLSAEDRALFDRALDSACEQAARDASDDAEASRENAWDRRKED